PPLGRLRPAHRVVDSGGVDVFHGGEHRPGRGGEKFVAHRFTRRREYARASSTIAVNNRRSSREAYGCHCTASTKSFPGSSIASMIPSSSRALTTSFGPTSAIAWWW